jgi:hypothetical protein
MLKMGCLFNLPTGAVIQDMSLTMNATHLDVTEFAINVMAPNNNIFNLFVGDDFLPGSYQNMLNTTWSSSSENAINNATTPFTGTFEACANIFQGSPTFLANVIVWMLCTSLGYLI